MFIQRSTVAGGFGLSIIASIGMSFGVASVMMPVGSAAAQPLYAVGDFGTFGSQSLFRIDTQSGVATLVGDTGVNGLIGLAWTGGGLVGLSSTNDVFRIDTNSGAAFFATSDFGVTPEGDLAFRDGGLIASTTSALVGFSGGIAETITSYPIPLDLSGLTDLDGADFLGFASGFGSGDALYRLGLDGSVALIGQTGTDSAGVGALDRDAAGTVFLSDGDELFTVDTLTGSATLVGAFGVDGVSGLAFVPTPGSVAAMVLAGFFASRRRR